MGITKLILICLIGAIIEVLQMVLIDKSYFLGKPDPDAVTVTAHKVHEPSFNYIPGRQTYDDKSRRYVIEWKYEWEYEGKKHSIMYSDNPNSQWELHMSTFPEEIAVTVHKKTGTYYIPRNIRAQGNKYLLSLAVSLIISAIIVNMFF